MDHLSRRIGSSGALAPGGESYEQYETCGWSERYVTLKCLECAHVERVLRRLLEGAGGALDSTGSLE